MNNQPQTQPQANQKNDLPSKPIVVENKPEAPKAANAPSSKPADAAKTGTA